MIFPSKKQDQPLLFESFVSYKIYLIIKHQIFNMALLNIFLLDKSTDMSTGVDNTINEPQSAPSTSTVVRPLGSGNYTLKIPM